MQPLMTFLIVLALVLAMGGVFVFSGVRGPWPRIGWFFLLLFIGTLAIGAWTQPIGPRPWGVPVLNFFTVALLLGLLIAAMTPATRQRDRRLGQGSPPPQTTDTDLPATPTQAEASATQGEREAVGAAAGIGVLFWSFIIFAAILLFAQVMFGPV
jgi:hypothetical protein